MDPGSTDNNALSANRALIAVSLAVLGGASTWLSGSAVAPVLEKTWGLNQAGLSWLSLSVQVGFVLGTLVYAVFNIADVFPAHRVFMVSAWGAATFNAGFAWQAQTLEEAIVWRGLTGLMLAGVYPVGMKLVASWFRSGLGWRLGVMVGALTVGSASSYLLKGLLEESHWRTAVSGASVAAFLGGALVGRTVRLGPFLPARSPFEIRMIFRVFQHRPFRQTAFGYFGHMWELYAFWSFISYYLAVSLGAIPAIPFWGFSVVAIGCFGCVLGGMLSRRVGEKKVASWSLWVSGTCCLGSGFIVTLPSPLVIVFSLIWGFFVIADSPQFSALAARYAPSGYAGTALTVQNGLGFLVTSLALQIVPWLASEVSWRWAFTVLALGPLFGVMALRGLEDESPRRDSQSS